MIQYSDLEWFIMFPFLCGVMMWFSIDLALLVRIGGGRRRRKKARTAIEQLVLRAPAAVNPNSLSYSNNNDSSGPRRSTSRNWSGGGGGGADRGSTALSSSSSMTATTTTTVISATTTTATTHQGAGGNNEQHEQQQEEGHRALGSVSGKPYLKVVDIPTPMRVATKAVPRRAVVVVGGDFARSPRMQYHAASLAQSGLFDEVVLVGFDCGNALSEALCRSGVAAPETFYMDNPMDEQETQNAVWERFRRPHDRRRSSRTGCLISVRYLVAPPVPPAWLQVVFPLRKLHWVACTLYKAVAYALVFSWLLARAMAIRVNVQGQMLLTDLVLVQAPPAVPFVLLIKYFVRPMAALYSAMVYYCFIVPVSWFNKWAPKEVVEQSHPLTHPTFTGGAPHGGGVGDGKRAAEADLTAWWRAGVIRWCIFWPALVVDWHNFGHTILEAARRPRVVTEAYRLLETRLCAGDINITVSAAMKRALIKRRIVPVERPRRTQQQQQRHHRSAIEALLHNGEGTVVEVLYDVAPSFFRPVSRQTFINEVVAPVNRITAWRHAAHNSSNSGNSAADGANREGAATTTTIIINNNNNNSNNGTNNEDGGEAARARAALLDGGWGISPPPAWVTEEIVPSRGPSTPHKRSSAEGGGAAAAATGMAARRRGLMVVGSTSWTEDDDYTILIEALQRLDHRLKHEYKYLDNNNNHNNNNSGRGGGASAAGRAPPLDVWVLITGKGPARARFEAAVRTAGLSSHVVVSTVYLQSYQQYSVTIGAADLGLCLHYSSSGLDLPMKGVDMVGCGLPVAALSYPAIGELMGQTAATGAAGGKTGGGGGLVECERGWVFSTAADLEKLLGALVGLDDREPWSGSSSTGNNTPFPAGSVAAAAAAAPLSMSQPTLAAARLLLVQQMARNARRPTWEENWNATVKPILDGIL